MFLDLKIYLIHLLQKFVHIHLCVCVCVCGWVHTCMHLHVCVHMYVYVRMHMHEYVSRSVTFCYIPGQFYKTYCNIK
jgi:hypothetical protein